MQLLIGATVLNVVKPGGGKWKPRPVRPERNTEVMSARSQQGRVLTEQQSAREACTANRVAPGKNLGPRELVE